MFRLAEFHPASVALLSLALALTGCTASFTMPDTTQAAASHAGGSFGTIQGSNYGGHAPLVGAHVYLLQGATGGYNAAATSLLASGETAGPDFHGSVYTTAQNTVSGSPTYGDYYVKTDSYGDFNLSNGYTCTPGLPVYLYAQGGNPESNPNSGFNVTVTAASIAGSGPYTISFTTTGSNLIYQGESITLSGFSGNFGTYINGTTQTVLADANLTTTSFDISVTTLTGNSVTLATGAQTGGAGTATQFMPIVSNPAAVNLAVLGICPSNGTANFSYLPFVYVNEVSTAAAAYALGGFFPAPGTSGLTNAGAVAANLSIPASDSLALLGLQNAAITAGQLYDISGGNVACNGSGCDGETHIARTTTPGVPVNATTTSGSATVPVGTSIGLLAGVTITGTGIPAGATIAAINTTATPNTITLSANATASGTVTAYAGAGNGTVPQSLLDLVGNILANCVDSANTYNPYTAAGTASTQCSSLFADAKSAGTSGTSPVDTATAAIDIAHNPWANVSTLVDLPTGNQPFQPSLAAANDLSVGIEYLPTNVCYPEGLAIDGKGRIWFPNAGGTGCSGVGYVTTLTPFGGVQYHVNVGGSPDYIAIDGNGSAWFDNKTSSALQSVSSAGVFVGSYIAGTLSGNNSVSVDGTNGTGYIYSGISGSPGSYGKYSNTGAAVVAPLTGSEGCLANTNAHSAIDNANNGYNLWVTGEAPDNVCVVNTSTGAVIRTITINAATGIGSSYQPEVPAIDVSGAAWIPNQHNPSITRITQAGVVTTIADSALNGGFGADVDGAGNIFVTSRANNVVTEILGATATPVSLVTFYGGGNVDLFLDPLNIHPDLSGNLWVANYQGSRIVELLGVAAPTWEPLSDAANHNKLGSKP